MCRETPHTHHTVQQKAKHRCKSSQHSCIHAKWNRPCRCKKGCCFQQVEHVPRVQARKLCWGQDISGPVRDSQSAAVGGMRYSVSQLPSLAHLAFCFRPCFMQPSRQGSLDEAGCQGSVGKEVQVNAALIQPHQLPVVIEICQYLQSNSEMR